MVPDKPEQGSVWEVAGAAKDMAGYLVLCVRNECCEGGLQGVETGEVVGVKGVGGVQEGLVG